MRIVPWIRKWGRSKKPGECECVKHPSEMERIRHEVRYGIIGAYMCLRDAEKCMALAARNLKKMSGHLERAELAVKGESIKPE